MADMPEPRWLTDGTHISVYEAIGCPLSFRAYGFLSSRILRRNAAAAAAILLALLPGQPSRDQVYIRTAFPSESDVKSAPLLSLSSWTHRSFVPCELTARLDLLISATREGRELGTYLGDADRARAMLYKALASKERYVFPRSRITEYIHNVR